MNLPDHGANPDRLYDRLGMKVPSRIIDFSENVHPFGPPSFVAEKWASLLPLIMRYPETTAEPFRSAAARYHGLEKSWLAAGNGAAEVFTWLARRYRGKRVLLIEPAFSEYRKTLEAEGADISVIQLSAENSWRLQMDVVAQTVNGQDALYVCNPHNPTGYLLTLAELTRLAEACGRAGCELVIDEAFIDFAGEEFSFAGALPDFPHVIIVRSMTKMYALAGLRLGYVMAAPDRIRQLTEGAAHWNVNALAAYIGAQCFAEEAYRKNVQEAMKRERDTMTQFLVNRNFEATDSAVNFLAFRLPEGMDPELFFTDLLKAGFVLRHTENFSGMDGEWFRIGMKTAGEMEALRGAIDSWLGAN